MACEVQDYLDRVGERIRWARGRTYLLRELSDHIEDQRSAFEAQGLPLLILDGDGCDRSHGGEGQTATRLGAFLEMLDQAQAGGTRDE